MGCVGCACSFRLEYDQGKHKIGIRDKNIQRSTNKNHPKLPSTLRANFGPKMNIGWPSSSYRISIAITPTLRVPLNTCPSWFSDLHRTSIVSQHTPATWNHTPWKSQCIKLKCENLFGHAWDIKQPSRQSSTSVPPLPLVELRPLQFIARSTASILHHARLRVSIKFTLEYDLLRWNEKWRTHWTQFRRHCCGFSVPARL